MEEINLKTIPVAYALNDAFLYPTIVSMTSVLECKNEETFIHFYILHSEGELSEESKNKLQSLEKKYRNCAVEIINCKDANRGISIDARRSVAAYHRLLLPNLLPDTDKIIYLDGDTLAYADLSEMYDIDMTNYYVKGYPDEESPWNSREWTRETFGVERGKHIISGVILLNLDLIRKNKIDDRIKEFIEQHPNDLAQHDQTIINIVMREKLGFLPARWGDSLKGYKTIWQMREVMQLPDDEIYTEEEMDDAEKNPGIQHLTWKPWSNHFVAKHGIFPSNFNWALMAQRSDFAEEIFDINSNIGKLVRTNRLAMGHYSILWDDAAEELYNSINEMKKTANPSSEQIIQNFDSMQKNIGLLSGKIVELNKTIEELKK